MKGFVRRRHRPIFCIYFLGFCILGCNMFFNAKTIDANLKTLQFCEIRARDSQDPKGNHPQDVLKRSVIRRSPTRRDAP